MPEPVADLAQAEAYDAQGNPIAPEAVGDAVAKGQAFFKKGARVYAKNADGELVTVAAEDAAKPGYQVLGSDQLRAEVNRKKYGDDAGDIALATAAGAARGLTLGASDAVLSGLGGDDTRRALQGLREANPIASGVGEVAGAAAPVILSGGTSAAAQAGVKGAGLGAKALAGTATAVRTAGVAPRAAAAAGGIAERGVARGLQALGYEGGSVASRAAAGAAKTAAAGLTEGAIYGGAQAANDAVLNGDAITAEKIVAGMGRGALFGGAVGGVLGAAGPLVGGVAAKLKPSKEGLETLAREQALKSVARGWDIRKLAGRSTGEAADRKLAVTADDLLNYEFKSGPLKGERAFVPGRNTEELLERITLAKEELGAAIGGVKKELSERMAASGDGPDVGEFLKRVDAQVIGPLMKSKSPGAMSKARAVQRELKIIREEFEQGVDRIGLINSRYARDGMRDMTSIRKAYAGATPEQVRAIANGELPPMGSASGKPLDPVRIHIEPGSPPILNDGRHRMLAAQEAGAETINARIVTYDGDGNALSEVIRPVSINPKPTSFDELDAFRGRLREVFQPAAPTTGGLPSAPPKAAQYLEQTERILADYLKEKASTTLLKAGENPNAYNELNRQFSSFRKLEQIAGKNANQYLGNRTISPTDHALGLTSFMSALATGNVGALGAMAYGGAAAMANKLLRERGNSMVAHYAQRAAQMDDRIEQVAQVLAGRVNVKPPALAASLQGEGLRDSYQKTSERIRELARPQMAASHVSGLLPEVAAQYPRVGSAVSAKLLSIYQQLAAKLPQSHVDTGETLTPLAIQRRTSPQAMRSFMSAVKGALEPEEVIAELGNGIIDREAIEALKMAHPETFTQLRNKVADFVEQNEDELPFKRRVMLSLTFDFAGDSSLEPARMAGLQQAAQSISSGAGEQPQGAPPPKRGRPGVSRLGKSFATPADSAFGGNKS
jgi:hypothetical protein